MGSSESRGFYARWIGACTAGELIGIAVAAGVAVSWLALVGEPASLGLRLVTLLVFALVGAIEGGALAALQFRVLRSRLPRLRAAEWIGATMTVAMLGWIAGMIPSTFAVADATPVQEPGLVVVIGIASIAGAGAGLCFGLAQWLVLRRYAARAHRWIWIHVPAWALALPAVFLGAMLPTEQSPAWMVVAAGGGGGILGGVLLGAVTGLVARSLMPLAREPSAAAA